MAYPSTLSSFTDPNPTDKLSTTPHSSIESAQNTALEEIQAFIGTESSNVGTLMYDIRATASGGGGHVQAANKGGTGQTTFSKGDVLVAQSSSVLAKLAVGTDNQALLADSSVASGVKWGGVATGGQIQNFEFSWGGLDSGDGSVFAIYPSPCVLSYTDGQLFGFRAANANTTATPALSVSSLVAKGLRKPNSGGLAIGQISAGDVVLSQYNGSASVFQVIAPIPTSSSYLGAVIGAGSGGVNSILSGAQTAIITSSVLTNESDGNYVGGQCTLKPTGMTSQKLSFGEEGGDGTTQEYEIKWVAGEIRTSVLARANGNISYTAYFYD